MNQQQIKPKYDPDADTRPSRSGRPPISEPQPNRYGTMVGGARPNSGRPRGVPNLATLQFRDYVRNYTTESIDHLVGLIRQEGWGVPPVGREGEAGHVPGTPGYVAGMPPKDGWLALAAIKELLSRGYGKPPQHIQIIEEMRGIEQYPSLESFVDRLREKGLPVDALFNGLKQIEHDQDVRLGDVEVEDDGEAELDKS